MTESNRPPEPGVTITIEPFTTTIGRGRGWRFLWTLEADLLHREALEVLERVHDESFALGNSSRSSVLGWACDAIRAGEGYDENALTDARFTFAAWLQQFAPWTGLRGLEMMLELRAKARGWT